MKEKTLYIIWAFSGRPISFQLTPYNGGYIAGQGFIFKKWLGNITKNSCQWHRKKEMAHVFETTDQAKELLKSSPLYLI